ncbi:MAG: hypothetical protein HY291_11870 [Planctomycetes bacterium]|nr:hypothetical protein [Planctomycetota bacterium]
MITARLCLVALMLGWLAWGGGSRVQAQADAPLPSGVKAVWEMEKAQHEKSGTRERVCINGLWRWQPHEEGQDKPPAEGWGYFKVPGSWPGVGDYMQKDSQTVFANPAWKEKPSSTVSAWYERDVTIPADWNGQRIALRIEYLNSVATVYVDGKAAAQVIFPGGEADLTEHLTPGKHELAILVNAMQLKDVRLNFGDSAAPKEVKPPPANKKVVLAYRGICGDVFLIREPKGARIAAVKIETSVRKEEVTVDAALGALKADEAYTLRAKITENGRAVGEIAGKPFKGSELKDGRITFTGKWKAEKHWDIHTPQNQYDLQLSLLDAAGHEVDAAIPARFGYREFYIDGRDFYLNGSRIYLSCVPIDNAQIGAAAASYEGAKETLLRMKSVGINFVYTHNYGCVPGSHLGFTELLRAADDVGMLVGFSMPHCGNYDWKTPDAEKTNGYARDAEYYVRMAENHPAVVFYSMNHNACGYADDMNPDYIGVPVSEEVRGSWSMNNVRSSLKAEAIVKGFDPSRIVYHHSGGSLGSMWTCNFYPNFVPIQELSDWFEPWSKNGTMPAFTCEYGAPFGWDFTMYRGWNRDENGKWVRVFGSAVVPWEDSKAEWNAQFLGDPAFKITEMEKANLRWERKKLQPVIDKVTEIELEKDHQKVSGLLVKEDEKSITLKVGAEEKTFKKSEVKAVNRVMGWHRWDYPAQIGCKEQDEQFPVMALYMTDNWRAFRTLGLSSNSPWEFSMFWKTRAGLDRNARKECKVDWENLQRPGFSADFLESRYESFCTTYERADWVPSKVAESLARNNMPLLAYIAGKPAQVTSKDHNFRGGESAEKQLVVINNSRETVDADCEWSLALPAPLSGSKKVTIKTGDQERVLLHFDLPDGAAPGAYALTASVKFNTGETQKDTFTVHILPAPEPVKAAGKIALFDPKGETAKGLAAAGIAFTAVAAGDDLAAYDVLVIGKAALTLEAPGPDVNRVRAGLKAIVFEQTADVLEKRFGFRIAEYGMRNTFRRVPDHPVLAGLDSARLCDWRGDSTLLPPRIKLTTNNAKFSGNKCSEWCGMTVPALFRCGNRGNVASALIEKPARGDFLPLVDCGYSLQYSPLLEYHDGAGLILFCQMDVTGRTESDPAADTIVRNLVRYAAGWKAAPVRKALYAGDAAGKKHLAAAGIDAGVFEGGNLNSEQVLIVGPGAGQKLGSQSAAIAAWLKGGGHLLSLGLDESEANAYLPFKLATKSTEHIAAYFDEPDLKSGFAGIGPADVHNRDPRDFPLVTGGATILGDGVLAKAENAEAVFCQLVPWQFEYKVPQNIKRTFRRSTYLVTRLLANMGVQGSTPILERIHTPVDAAKGEKRWLDGLYLDQPEEWDDPYRHFRW